MLNPLALDVTGQWPCFLVTLYVCLCLTSEVKVKYCAAYSILLYLAHFVGPGSVYRAQTILDQIRYSTVNFQRVRKSSDLLQQNHPNMYVEFHLIRKSSALGSVFIKGKGAYGSGKWWAGGKFKKISSKYNRHVMLKTTYGEKNNFAPHPFLYALVMLRTVIRI